MASLPTRTKPVVLLVEDEFLVADELATAFQEAGAAVLGPAATVNSALQLIDNTGQIDGAVLDINLKGSFVFPVSEALMERQVPFVFTTGYSEPPEFRRYKNIRLFLKPFYPHEVVSAMLRLLRGDSSGDGSIIPQR